MGAPGVTKWPVVVLGKDTGETYDLSALVAGGGAVTLADGADVTLGAKADAKSTATDTTAISAMSIWKQISASVQSLVAFFTATAYSDANRLPVEQRDGLAVSGTATSTATLFTQDMLGYESISVQVTSAGSTCTITYETSDDNTNWLSTTGIVSTAAGSNSTIFSATTTTAVLTVFPKRGRYFRARVSTYTSGTVTVAGTLHKNPAMAIVGVSGNVNATGVGLAAHDAAINGAPNRVAGRALTANYTAVQTGDTADLITTLVGALINKPYSIPEADWNYAAATNGIVNINTAVTIKTAGAAGLRNYITGIQFTAEALGTATELAIRDGAGGTVLWKVKIGTGGLTGGMSVRFPTPLGGTAATLLEVITLTASGTGAVYFNAQGYTAP